MTGLVTPFDFTHDRRLRPRRAACCNWVLVAHVRLSFWSLFVLNRSSIPIGVLSPKGGQGPGYKPRWRRTGGRSCHRSVEEPVPAPGRFRRWVTRNHRECAETPTTCPQHRARGGRSGRSARKKRRKLGRRAGTPGHSGNPVIQRRGDASEPAGPTAPLNSAGTWCIFHQIALEHMNTWRGVCVCVHTYRVTYPSRIRVRARPLLHGRAGAARLFPSATRLASDARMQQKTQRLPAADAGAISAAGNKLEQALLRRGTHRAVSCASGSAGAGKDSVQTELESKP